MKNNWKILVIVLFLAAVAVWLAVFTTETSKLKIIACDVGQGDAILITFGSTQILTDGGPPNGKVIECMGRHMPFWDRTVEVVVNTHPQLDHYGGLIDVFKRYNVKYFLANNLDSGSQEYRVLKDEVEARGIKVINPDDKLSVRVGLIHLDILWPNTEFLSENTSMQIKSGDNHLPNGGAVLGSTITSLDPNQFSVVTALRFRNFDALLTGDIDPKISDKITRFLKNEIHWEYIKVPHHGSKNGLTKNLLKNLDPDMAVISAAKNNRYGHPHKELIEMLDDADVKIFGTYESGDVVVTTDGTKYWLN